MKPNEDAIIFMELTLDYCRALRDTGETVFRLQDFANALGYKIVGAELDEFELTDEFMNDKKVAYAMLERVFFSPRMH